jgi:energy-coupling factor transporter transmembrane protein EcfT
LSRQDDPVLRHARREGILIAMAWLAATVYCCVYCYAFGYIRADRPRTAGELTFVAGIPSWFFWGVIVPWGVCFAFIVWFAGFYMAEDDLGADHSAELLEDIREGAARDD